MPLSHYLQQQHIHTSARISLPQKILRLSAEWNRLETKHFLQWDSDFLEMKGCVCVRVRVRIIPWVHVHVYTHAQQGIINHKAESEKPVPSLLVDGWFYSTVKPGFLARGSIISSCLFVRSLFMKGCQMKAFSWRVFCLLRELSISMPLVSPFFVSALHYQLITWKKMYIWLCCSLQFSQHTEVSFISGPLYSLFPFSKVEPCFHSSVLPASPSFLCYLLILWVSFKCRCFRDLNLRSWAFFLP